MRKVAGYLISAKATPGDSSPRLDAINLIAENWVGSKGTRTTEGAITYIAYRDGRRAEYLKSEIASTHGRVIEHDLVEPTDTGLFHTHIALGVDGNELAAYIELRAAGDAYQVGPMQLDVRCPQVVRDLVQCGEQWSIGATPVTSKPMSFSGEKDGITLVKVVWHPNRNLPIVAISRHEGALLTGSFAENLASDLSGLALVADLDDEASWTLTKNKGKEWSCYNGAIRLYWPMTARSQSPYAHPLWTRLGLLRGVMDSNDASYRVRGHLRRRIIGVSAFSVSEPPFFGLIRSEARKRDIEALRSRAAGTEEWQKLAEDYAKDNDKLREQLARKEEVIRDLQSRVSNLELAVRWQTGTERDPNVDLEPEQEIPPATVVEAIEKARDGSETTLVFGDDVAIGARSLAIDAGPPEKILNYLRQLSALAEERQKGPLGANAIQWLRDRGVIASGESETVRNSSSEMRKRTWHDGKDRRVFELHLKPNEAASPDRCARIYFDYDENRKRVIIGWVGRHP